MQCGAKITRSIYMEGMQNGHSLTLYWAAAILFYHDILLQVCVTTYNKQCIGGPKALYISQKLYHLSV